MTNLITWAARQPWLAGGAVWALTAAAAALNAFGWAQSATGLVAIVLVTAAISAEILGVRMAFAVERAIASRAWVRSVIAVVLLCGVSAFNCYSGHRALTIIEADRAAPYRAAQAARAEAEAEVNRIAAAMAAVPALPENVPAVRLVAYQTARMAELARLEPQLGAARERLSQLPKSELPPEPINPALMWAIMGLIEALKVFGIFAVAGPIQHSKGSPASQANVVSMNAAARALGRASGEARRRKAIAS